MEWNGAKGAVFHQVGRPLPVAAGFPGGEGPVWSRHGFLIFSGYSQDRLYNCVPGGTPEVYREDSHGANGNTMDRQGRLVRMESARMTSRETLHCRARRAGVLARWQTIGQDRAAGKSAQPGLRRQRVAHPIHGWKLVIPRAAECSWFGAVLKEPGQRSRRVWSTAPRESLLLVRSAQTLSVLR